MMINEIPWQDVASCGGAVVLLSILIERALSLPFEHLMLKDLLRGKKEIIAFLVSTLVCFIFNVDLLGTMFPDNKQPFVGIVLTGAIVAGGSKASISFFHNVLKATNKTSSVSNLG